jgi:type IV pilus assembly protein PilX
MLHSTNKICRRERGAALVTSLLMLLVMTVLGLAAMQVTRMEERMAGNSRDVNVAFQGAEAGLRDSEDLIRVMTARPGTCGSLGCGGIYQLGLLSSDLRDQDDAWWVANGREYGVAGTKEMTEATRDPRIVTDDMGFISDSLTVGHGPPEGRNFYRITSSSTGASATANVVVESTYTRRF